jgi:signal transduction histidine kinase
MSPSNAPARPARASRAPRALRSWLAACILAVAASGACAADRPEILAPAERAWLDAHPHIVLGAGEDWAPSIVPMANGKVSGFAVEHMELINRKLGSDIRIEAGPWHDMVARAEAGTLDGLILTAPLDERRDQFAFTQPYFTDFDFVYVRSADTRWKDGRVRLDDLRGRHVGYLNGTLRISRELSRIPGTRAVAADSYDALARMLLEGDVDVVVASYSLEYWRMRHGVMGLNPTVIIRETESRMVMTIRKDRSELAAILDKAMAAIDPSELTSLYQRWFGPDYLARTAAVGAVFDAEERKWLAEHPVLRIGIDPGWAPVEYFDDAGKPRGMTLAYLDRLQAITGVRFEIVPKLTWDEAVRRLHERELDLLPAIAATPERLGKITFTEPYLSFPAAIFSAADVAYLGGVESLKGRRVVVVRGEAVFSWLEREWPDLDVVRVDNTSEALRMLASGDAFAFVGNLVTTSYYIGKSGLSRIKVVGETPFTYRLSMGVRGDWPILARILQKGIDAIPAADRDAIFRDWLSIRYEHAMDYSLLWKVVAAAAVILLLVFAERTYRVHSANARLRHLARELSLVENRERRRLAGELHDSPMQKLALAQMQFGAAHRDPAAPASPRVQSGLDLMREAIDELRSLQFELSPPMLHREGLAPALRWLASSASERSGVRFAFVDRNSALPALPEEIETVLFRCARELVFNVAKHASAQQATIELDVAGEKLILTVRDDGTGFAPTATRRARRRGGFGLFSISERLALFGGDLDISTDTGGTCARIRIPLPATTPGPRSASEASAPRPAADAPGAAP